MDEPNDDDEIYNEFIDKLVNELNMNCEADPVYKIDWDSAAFYIVGRDTLKYRTYCHYEDSLDPDLCSLCEMCQNILKAYEVKFYQEVYPSPSILLQHIKVLYKEIDRLNTKINNMGKNVKI